MFSPRHLEGDGEPAKFQAPRVAGQEDDDDVGEDLFAIGASAENHQVVFGSFLSVGSGQERRGVLPGRPGQLADQFEGRKGWVGTPWVVEKNLVDGIFSGYGQSAGDDREPALEAGQGVVHSRAGSAEGVPGIDCRRDLRFGQLDVDLFFRVDSRATIESLYAFHRKEPRSVHREPGGSVGAGSIYPGAILRDAAGDLQDRVEAEDDVEFVFVSAFGRNQLSRHLLGAQPVLVLAQDEILGHPRRVVGQLVS